MGSMFNGDKTGRPSNGKGLEMERHSNSRNVVYVGLKSQI